MAKDGQPSRSHIRLTVPAEWTPVPADVPELLRAAKAAGRHLDHFLQLVWQTRGSRVQLRGRWDWVHAEFTTLDWPPPERSRGACHVDSRGGRILVYNPVTGRADSGARVIHDLQWRLQPLEAEAAGSAPTAALSDTPLISASAPEGQPRFPPPRGRYGHADCILAFEILADHNVNLPVTATELSGYLPLCVGWAGEWLKQDKEKNLQRVENKPGFERSRKRLRDAQWAILKVNQRGGPQSV